MSAPRLARLPLLLVLLLVLAACGQPAQVGVTDERVATTAGQTEQASLAPSVSTSMPEPTDSTGQANSSSLGGVVTVREIDRRPHDGTAFTQGLEFDGERLFESRGLYQSEELITLTEIDPADGSTVRTVDRAADVGDYFAEGLTVVGDRLIQLTWRSATALVYDVASLELVEEYTYDGEGWGICDFPDRLMMSNGTSTLTQRDLATFEVIDTVTVTLDGQEVQSLNELECVDGMVWANVWNTNRIVVIDPDSGDVQTVVDASALADDRGRFVEDPESGSVLNGIAYQPETDTWLLTGKRWPFMFEVAFDCADSCDTTQALGHYVRLSGPPLSATGS